MSVEGEVKRQASLIRQVQGALDGKSIRSGAVTVTWPGGSTSSDTITVAHGLGSLPVSAVGTLNSQAGSGFCFVEVAFDATNVSVRLATASFTPGSGVTNPVSWEVRG